MVGKLVLVAGLLVLGAVDETFAQHQQNIPFGDRPAKPGEFPCFVSLRDRDIHFCGGCLIGNQYVLTAAHCIVGVVKPPFIGIAVVTGTISSSEDGEYHMIKDIVVHPDYVNDIQESYKNDIAIIKLEAPITPNVFQRPIPVASYDYNANTPVTAIGMGLLRDGGSLAPILKKIDVNILSNELCQSYWGKEQLLYDTNLCTRFWRGKGVCKGDSGSPLVFYGELVGIASLAYKCAQGLPDIYTRASHYLDFINSTVKA